MIKKLTAVAGATALLLSMASPALGWWFGSDDITVNNGHTMVITTAAAGADTGDNSQMGGKGSQTMSTGNATAWAGAGASVNHTSVLLGCGCLDGDIEVNNRGTFVLTTALAGADSGDNWQFMMGGHHGRHHHGHGGSQVLRTGNAYADSLATSSVNMTLVSVGGADSLD